MEAVKSANELRDMQRANQVKSDFQEFTPDLTTDFAGLKLGAQPETYNIAKETEAARLAKEEQDYKDRLAKRTNIDPDKAPPTSSTAMQTNYNQFQNEVDRLYKGARTTGITPNVFTDSPPLTDQLFESLGVDTPLGEGYIYKRDADGNPISAFGNPEDEYQTRLGIIRYLRERDKDLPLGMTGMDDVDRYIEYGRPNMQPGAAANELQNRITKQQQKEFAATLDFTKDERKELDRVSKIIDPNEKSEAKKTIAKKIDIRRQRDRLKEIKNLPDGPDKLEKLNEFRAGLRTSILDDEKIYKARADGSFDTVGVPKILEEIRIIKENTDPSKIANTFQNVTLSSANDTVRMAIQKRDQIVAQANIAKSEGNREKFEQLVSQLSALDNGIVLAQGMQGLNDLDVGDTRRLNATLSNSLGRNVQIIPRDDNSFDVTGLEEGTKTMSAADIKRKGRLIFDQAHKKQMKEIAMETAKLELKNKLEIRKEAFKSTAAYNQARMEKIEERITELKKKGYTITKTDDGTVIEKDGAIGMLDVRMGKDALGEDAEFLYVKDINTMELGSGLGVSDYIGATQ